MDGRPVLWGATRERIPEKHLRLIERKTTPVSYRIMVDVDLLYDHVLAAFQKVSEDVRKDGALAKTVHAGLCEVDSPRVPRSNKHIWTNMRSALQNVDPRDPKYDDALDKDV